MLYTCSTATGNLSLGYDVSQSLKSGCVFSGVNSSQMRSSVGIHDTAKWQFCNATHVPFSRACAWSDWSRSGNGSKGGGLRKTGERAQVLDAHEGKESRRRLSSDTHSV